MRSWSSTPSGTDRRRTHAAAIATRVLEQVDLARGTLAIMQELHGALRGSRGAAITLVLEHGAELEACGVGNVGMRLIGDAFPFVASPGVVGAQVRRFRVASGGLSAHARLYLYSDGISQRFEHDSYRHLAPHAACEALLADHGKAYDDATVLVADLAPPV